MTIPTSSIAEVVQVTAGGPRRFHRHISMNALSRVMQRSDAAVRRDRTAASVAIVTGLIFIPAGLVKFVFHAWELHAFRAFGLPWPGAVEVLAGVIESLGGALLALRLLVVPVSLVLAATMVAAIGVSGVGHGDTIPSLTLAPALLLALVYLIARASRLN